MRLRKGVKMGIIVMKAIFEKRVNCSAAPFERSTERAERESQ
jgi:hypothetical protein